MFFRRVPFDDIFYGSWNKASHIGEDQLVIVFNDIDTAAHSIVGMCNTVVDRFPDIV